MRKPRQCPRPCRRVPPRLSVEAASSTCLTLPALGARLLEGGFCHDVGSHIDVHMRVPIVFPLFWAEHIRSVECLFLSSLDMFSFLWKFHVSMMIVLCGSSFAYLTHGCLPCSRSQATTHSHLAFPCDLRIPALLNTAFRTRSSPSIPLLTPPDPLSDSLSLSPFLLPELHHADYPCPS